MPVSLQDSQEPRVEILLDMLREYIEKESEATPFLIKDGVKIIF